MSYRLMPVRMSTIKKKTDAGDDVEEKKTLVYGRWRCDWARPPRKTTRRGRERVKRAVTWSGVPLLGPYSKEAMPAPCSLRHRSQ